MPILKLEPTQYPEDLFSAEASPIQGRTWLVLHTRPRQEKGLARQLYKNQVPFYLPLVARRLLVRGRPMTSHIPLFAGYLFLLGNDAERVKALATHRVVHALKVPDQQRLFQDLCQVHRLIDIGAPITPEDRLAPGMTVEIRSGPLVGLRGKIMRTTSGRRLVVQVDFIQRGASVELDDFALVRAD